MIEERAPSDAVERYVGLLAANKQKLYRYIVPLVPDLSDADDVFQETSIILWRKFSEFEPTVSSFSTWACSVAYNVARNAHAKRARCRLTFDDMLLAAISQEASGLERELDARYEALIHCLVKLAERDRNLLHLRYTDGATIGTVAQSVGRPVQGLYKAFQRIHRTLHECVRRALMTEREDE